MNTAVDIVTQLRNEAVSLGREEARNLVDTYYQIQEFRKASGNQRRAIMRGDDLASPIAVTWLHDNMFDGERAICRERANLTERVGRRLRGTNLKVWVCQQR